MRTSGAIIRKESVSQAPVIVPQDQSRHLPGMVASQTPIDLRGFRGIDSLCPKGGTTRFILLQPDAFFSDLLLMDGGLEAHTRQVLHAFLTCIGRLSQTHRRRDVTRQRNLLNLGLSSDREIDLAWKVDDFDPG